MSKTASVVEINGNRYDALTGRLLDSHKAIRSAVSSSGKKMIDGFVIAPHQRTKMKDSIDRKVTKATNLHRRPQRTKTLMRKAVKKPQASKAQVAERSASKPKIGNPIRELRAKTVTKHAKVNRFGLLPQKKQLAEVTPASKAMVVSASATEVMAPRVPSMVTSASHRKLENMLDEALIRADAHKHMLNRGRRARRIFGLPRWLAFSLAAVVLIIAAAILVWQNVPAVAVQVAADRAHVDASVPAYTPAGYALAKTLKYEPGSVTISYVNKANQGQTFSLTQKASSWDSSTVQSNYLPTNASTQTSQVNGTTVYIYGDSGNAAWVNNGVLYSLSNKAHLSSDDVFKIVQSL
ncbi:MAG TPA: DUF4367 domain-containing protein [Candidatus Binatia bacterium]|nr:DUF4367 domain-containing protein [Candidatus Binatia bacterium]